MANRNPFFGSQEAFNAYRAAQDRLLEATSYAPLTWATYSEYADDIRASRAWLFDELMHEYHSVTPIRARRIEAVHAMAAMTGEPLEWLRFMFVGGSR